MPPQSRSRFVEWALVAVVVVGFTAWAGRFIHESSFIAVDGQRRFCLFDDAMISMRYAHNLILGNGLVWNPGDRLEGITNLLMTLLMALSILVFGKFHGVLAVQIAGAVFLLLIAFSCKRIGNLIRARHGLEGGPLLPAIFLACGLGCYPLCYWSLLGMETGLLAALLFAATARAMRIDGSTRVDLPLSILLGLAFWTRPDAAVPGALIMLFRLSGVFRQRGSVRVVGVESAILGLFVVAISIFRLAYYGSLFPNTYVLKMTGWSASYRIESSLGYMSMVFDTLLPLLLLGLAGAALAVSRHTALLVAMVVASMGYQMYIGGDPTPYWRQMAPFVPLVLLLAVIGALRLRAILGRLAARSSSRGGWVSALSSSTAWLLVASPLALAAAGANGPFADEITFDRKAYTLAENARMTNTGLILERLSTPGASVGVLWAGAIPYFSERRAIDFLGRCDAHVARVEPDTGGGVAWRGMKSVPGHNKYDLSHSISKLQPTYIQVSAWGRDDLTAAARRDYEYVRYEGVLLRLRKGSPHVKWALLGKPG
jgi:hypothetical protein